VSVRKINPLFIVYTGRRGSGKTLSMIHDAFMYWKRGHEIYGNMEEIIFPGYKYIEPKNIQEITQDTEMHDCVLMLDEMQVQFDSLNNNKQAREFSHFVQQMRKRRILVLMTTQVGRNIHLRIRQQRDIVARPMFYPEYPVVRVDYYNWTIVDDELTFEPSLKTIVYDPTPFFQFYNHEEEVKIKKK